MIRRAVVSVATLLAVAFPAFAQDPAVPMLLNYQGQLKNASGVPQSGTFSMTFKFFDAESGGIQLPSAAPWTETQSVTVTDGVFNVLLGSVTDLPDDLFDGGPTDSKGPLRFLQVEVEGEALAPRKQVGSAAYAIGQIVDDDWFVQGDNSWSAAPRRVYIGNPVGWVEASGQGVEPPSDPFAGLGIRSSNEALLIRVINPTSPSGVASSMTAYMSKDSLEVGDTNTIRLGFQANNDVGGSPDLRFFVAMQAVVENPNASSKKAGLRFITNDPSPVNNERMRITHDGLVGIGTPTPSDKLEVVVGNIRVTNGAFIDDGTFLNAPDYVFEDSYQLPTLDEVRSFIDTNKHLPNVPSAAEIRENGLNLSQFQMRLLEKIEELTLYTLAQQEALEAAQARIDALEGRAQD